MELTGLEAALAGRALRSYPALLSTDAEAQAWARAGAPGGAVVAAGYQASPRGRGGLEWHVGPDDVAFSVIVRPGLPAEREGWSYVVVGCALADVVGSEARIDWPAEVVAGGKPTAAAGVHSQLGADGVEWATVTLLVRDVPLPHAETVAKVVSAIERRYGEPTLAVLAGYVRRCDTIRRRVTARLIPMGPGGVKVTGEALRVLADGALVIETGDARRIAVRPQSLGLLDVSS